MFQGQVIPVFIGQGGYNANRNVSQLAPEELIQADNLTFDAGTIQKEGGSALYTSAALSGVPTILGGHDWFPFLDTTQRSIIVGSDKKVRRDTGAGTYVTTLTTLTNTPTNTPVFVEGGREAAANPRKLFIYTGTNQVQTLSADGVTIANIANPPTDWSTTFPIGGCIHLSRHWGYGGDNPHWLYATDIADHEDFGTPFTFTGNLAASSPFTITDVTVPALMKIGNVVSGTAIQPGTLVSSFNALANTITLNTAMAQSVSSAAPSGGSSGAGYVVGDLLTGSSNTGTQPQFMVTAVNGSGAVTAVKVTSPGALTSIATNPTATTGGTGSGCTLELTFASLTDITFTCYNPNVINLPCYPGVGQGIAAIFSFKGQLVVGKYPRGIYFINTLDPNPENWYTVELSIEIGFAGPLCWAPVDDDIMFMDASGQIHMLSAVLEFGDYGLRSVSDLVYFRNFITDNVNFAYIPGVQTIFYLAKRECHFALPGVGQSVNTIQAVVDFNIPARIRFRYSDKDTLVSLWLRRDVNGVPRPIGGDALGQVWLLDQAAKSVNGAGYNSIFQTSHTDFSNINPTWAGRDKNFKFLELIGEPEGNYTISVDVYIDAKYSQTIQFNLGISSIGLGSFTLGTSSLGSDEVLASRHRLIGNGRTISIVGTMASANQDFSFAKAVYYWKLAAEKTP